MKPKGQVIKSISQCQKHKAGGWGCLEPNSEGSIAGLHPCHVRWKRVTALRSPVVTRGPYRSAVQSPHPHSVKSPACWKHGARGTSWLFLMRNDTKAYLHPMWRWGLEWTDDCWRLPDIWGFRVDLWLNFYVTALFKKVCRGRILSTWPVLAPACGGI